MKRFQDIHSQAVYSLHFRIQSNTLSRPPDANSLIDFLSVLSPLLSFSLRPMNPEHHIVPWTQSIRILTDDEKNQDTYMTALTVKNLNCQIGKKKGLPKFL